MHCEDWLDSHLYKSPGLLCPLCPTDYSNNLPEGVQQLMLEPRPESRHLLLLMLCLISTIKTVMMMVLFFLSLFPQHNLQGNILLSNIKWTLELRYSKRTTHSCWRQKHCLLLSELSMVRSKTFNLSTLRSGKWLEGDRKFSLGLVLPLLQINGTVYVHYSIFSWQYVSRASDWYTALFSITVLWGPH